jgi:hypothetical protein
MKISELLGESKLDEADFRIRNLPATEKDWSIRHEKPEPEPVYLKDLATVKVDFPDADFWIQRVGDLDTVGTVKDQYTKFYIGVKVNRTDILDPRYLKYVMMHLKNQGHFRKIAGGMGGRFNIRVSDIANLKLKMKSVNNMTDDPWKKYSELREVADIMNDIVNRATKTREMLKKEMNENYVVHDDSNSKFHSRHDK